MLLDALSDAAWLRHWLSNGAGSTLASYGLAARDLGALPRKHLDFYESLGLTASIGSYLFVHAGIRPGLTVSEQDAEDLVWIREPFLSSDANHGAIVVHGHTPVDVPDVHPNRINIDTGAVFSGNLTCLVLEGTSLRFLTVSMR
jgi:serine/threonine protein phosphatase 1